VAGVRCSRSCGSSKSQGLDCSEVEAAMSHCRAPGEGGQFQECEVADGGLGMELQKPLGTAVSCPQQTFPFSFEALCLMFHLQSSGLITLFTCI
jgi:hypothetical protein